MLPIHFDRKSALHVCRCSFALWLDNTSEADNICNSESLESQILFFSISLFNWISRTKYNWKMSSLRIQKCIKITSANFLYCSLFMMYSTSAGGRYGSFQQLSKLFKPITQIRCVWKRRSAKIKFGSRCKSVVIILSTSLIYSVASSKSNGSWSTLPWVQEHNSINFVLFWVNAIFASCECFLFYFLEPVYSADNISRCENRESCLQQDYSLRTSEFHVKTICITHYFVAGRNAKLISIHVEWETCHRFRLRTVLATSIKCIFILVLFTQCTCASREFLIPRWAKWSYHCFQKKESQLIKQLFYYYALFSYIHFELGRSWVKGRERNLHCGILWWHWVSLWSISDCLY